MDAGHARLAILVALGDEMAARCIEVVPATQCAQQFVGRHEAVAHQHRVDLEAVLAERGDERVAGRIDARQALPVEQRDAAPAQFGQHGRALPGEVEGARHHAQQRAGLRKARSLRQFRDRDDLGAGARQLQRDLQVERAVAADQDAAAGQHAVGLEQRLGRARGHDAGQRPSRHRHAALVGARRDDQAPWPEQQRLRGRRDADRQRREGAPRLGAGDDLDAGPLRPVDARAPFGDLRVGRDGGGEAMRFSRLLEELAAGPGALVDQHDTQPRLGGHCCR